MLKPIEAKKFRPQRLAEQRLTAQTPLDKRLGMSERAEQMSFSGRPSGLRPDYSAMDVPARPSGEKAVDGRREVFR
jgi:hypothetical protein